MPLRLRKIGLLLAGLTLAGIACTCPLTVVIDQLATEIQELPLDVDEIPFDLELPGLAPEADADPHSSSEPQSDSSLTREILDQMDEIEDQMVKIRGLQPTGPVDRTLLTSEELRQHVLDDFFADYVEEEAIDDARTLALFGLLEEDFGLYAFYIDLYSEQVAGFYDDEIKQMFVVQGPKFGGSERLTYAHEYVHALQDQHYDLSEGLGYNDEACEQDSERCAGIQALVEGDATLAEQQWMLTYATDQDWQDLSEFIDSFQSPVFDSAPAFMQQDFLFPYDFGFAFVDDLYLEGGWAAVDAVYADPPSSTEQILHPERYPDDRPAWLEVPEVGSALGEGWEPIDQDVLGEWYTLLVLQEYIGESEAEAAAEGWGGDYYVALFNEGQEKGMLVLGTKWDTVRDAHEFFGGFLSYGDARFGERILSSTTHAEWEGTEGFASIELRGDQTLWLLAPDEDTLRDLRDATEFPAAVLKSRN